MTTPDPAPQLWASTGLRPDGLDAVELTGPRDVLPSVFDVNAFASAIVKVATAAAIAVGGRRGTDHGPTAIDRRAVAAVFRSERHLRVNGAAPAVWDDLSGYYRCDDGNWVQLHCNYPHHRRIAAETLGATGHVSRDDLAGLVASRWAAPDVEDAVNAAGGCASWARTARQWDDHPHAAALATLPPVEISRVADAAPTRPQTGHRPLEGIRVLDLTRVIAGPVCGRVLAQHGADVLKVNAAHLPTVEACVIDTGFGKRTCHLDLDDAADRDTLLALVDDADVFVQGYRPGALEHRGLGVEALTARRPGLVYVTLSAYGHAGPWSGRRGFDSLVQTATGIGRTAAAIAGRDGVVPLPCQALDHGAGWTMAAGVMAALARRCDEGGSWHVRTSLAQMGRLLTGLGVRDRLTEPEPTAAEVARWCTTTDSPFGRLDHVGAVGRLDGTDTYDTPPAPIGSHPARW